MNEVLLTFSLIPSLVLRGPKAFLTLCAPRSDSAASSPSQVDGPPAQVLPGTPKVHHNGNHEFPLNGKPDLLYGRFLASAGLPSLWLPDTLSIKQRGGDVGKKILFFLSPTVHGQTPPPSWFIHHCPLSLVPTHDFEFWDNLNVPLLPREGQGYVLWTCLTLFPQQNFP